MDTKELQDKIAESFDVFGVTPFDERMNDIRDEFNHLIRFRDPKNLKEETGDLMASLIQLCNEFGWDITEVIDNTIEKISRRKDQYSSMGRKIKVAILGGAFDPIHNGHIKLAQFVLNNSGEIDEVWLMPPANHLSGKKMASSEDRLEMCRLASERDGRITVFDYEIKNNLGGETYFFFKKLLKDKDLNDKYDFSMIIGLDNANYFDKWVNYKQLENMAKFIVVPRKGVERKAGVNWYLKSPHIFMDEATDIDEISSTTIKNMLKNDDPAITKFLDPKVLKYIKDRHLYTAALENYFTFIGSNQYLK